MLAPSANEFYANGFSTRTPKYAWPGFKSSDQMRAQPASSAAATIMPSQKWMPYSARASTARRTISPSGITSGTRAMASRIVATCSGRAGGDTLERASVGLRLFQAFPKAARKDRLHVFTLLPKRT